MNKGGDGFKYLKDVFPKWCQIKRRHFYWATNPQQQKLLDVVNFTEKLTMRNLRAWMLFVSVVKGFLGKKNGWKLPIVSLWTFRCLKIAPCPNVIKFSFSQIKSVIFFWKFRRSVTSRIKDSTKILGQWKFSIKDDGVQLWWRITAGSRREEIWPLIKGKMKFI